MSYAVSVKKQGANTYTVYLDGDMRTPLPISSFEDEPSGFPQTGNLGQIQAMFPGKELRIINRPETKPNEATARDRAFDQQVEAQLVNILKSPTNDPLRPGNSKTAPSQKERNLSQPDAFSGSSSNDRSRFLSYFQRLLDQYQVAAKNKKHQIKCEIEAVAAVGLEIWSDIEPDLLRLKEQCSKPRFSLD